MLTTTVIVVHIVACAFLVLVVLLQTGKGSDIGAVLGGGSSETLFGSSGAGNLLTKLTAGTAAIFMLTSLIMTYGSAHETTRSLFDSTPPQSGSSEAAADRDADALPADQPGDEASDHVAPGESGAGVASPTAASDGEPADQTSSAPSRDTASEPDY